MSSLSAIGKKQRLSRIFASDSKSVIFAMDHGFERGPSVFTGETIDPGLIMKKVVDAALKPQ